MSEGARKGQRMRKEGMSSVIMIRYDALLEIIIMRVARRMEEGLCAGYL